MPHCVHHPSRPRWVQLVVVSSWVSAAALACVQFGGLFRPVPESICHSEEIWTYQDKDSPLMNPGRSCVQCHADENDEFHAPFYKVGGTVMQDLHDADDCRGAAQQIVIVTDGLGNEHQMRTNTAGNFWLDADVELVPPFSARIIDTEGRQRVKQVPVDSGDCASCHTAEGDQGAPGRLTPPDADADVSGDGGAPP
jgi:hypothetical protein